MATPVILAGARTPFVRAGDRLRDVPAKELARRVVQEVLEGSGISPASIDEVILGNAATPSDAPNIARVVALTAGLPESTPGLTVHRNCASGMEAVVLAAQKIAAGDAQAIVCGGTESMSRIPMQLSPDANPWFLQFAKAKSPSRKLAAVAAAPFRKLLPRSPILEGLTDPVCGLNMGRTAENLAREFGITREEQDDYALESHRRAVAAQAAGAFDDEIVPVYVGPEFRAVVTADVGPRASQSKEALAKLRPVFERVDGTVTAGNSCQITDGAAALIVASESWATAAGFRPLARIRSHATRGLAPARMGLGPAFAIPEALDRAGISFGELGRIEINEAFAAQVLACERALASRTFANDALGRSAAVGTIDRTRLNVHGGAIALGHPIGATGARLLVTLVAQLMSGDEELGLASLCVGGGQGMAVVLERLA